MNKQRETKRENQENHQREREKKERNQENHQREREREQERERMNEVVCGPFRVGGCVLVLRLSVSPD
jgi:hypothetical protein